jgi:hypothetical protein
MKITRYLLEAWFVTSIIAVSMLAAWRAGIILGRWLRAGNDAAPQFDNESMALFGLLLAFAFGTSLSKFDQRCIAVVQDSNAIGDVLYLRDTAKRANPQ